ncbi:FAD-dependent oxidoreductase, partial [Acinetobacter baumannii]
ETMELDSQGRPQPTGRFETLSVDAVVLALGQQTDSAFLKKIPGAVFLPDGTISVSASMMTGRPGIFAGGDAVPNARTATAAVGH